MAIPFNLPTQHTQDGNEILDQLLEHLHEILLEILRQRRRLRERRTTVPTLLPHNREAQRQNNADENNASREPEPSVNQNQDQAANSDAMRRVLPLLDIVPITNTRSAELDAPIPPPRRGTPVGGVRVRTRPQTRRSRRSRSVSSNEKPSAVPTDNRTRENWQEVGNELRKIADEFCLSSSLKEEEPQTTSHPHNMKKESLLSLLLPPRLQGPVWTAVIFLVGWRFLAKSGW